MEFHHKPPDGYVYEFEENFKRSITAIWIVNCNHFNYCGKSHVGSIWGFFNTKTKTYYSPINSKTIGSAVDINNTTPYSALIPKLTALEKFFC